MNWIGELFLSAIILSLLDGAFIYTNLRLFKEEVAGIQRTVMQVKPEGAIACYFFLIFGLYYFIIRKRRPIFDAFLFGLVIYGVYELTGYTIFKRWNPYLVILDTLWGGVLMALTTAFVYYIRGTTVPL